MNGYQIIHRESLTEGDDFARLPVTVPRSGRGSESEPAFSSITLVITLVLIVEQQQRINLR